MKTFVFDFKDPSPGDLIIINAADPRGGKISAKHKIAPARVRATTDADGMIVSTENLPQDGPVEIARSLAGQISKEWMPECVQATVKGDTGQLIVKCTDHFNTVLFTTEVHGEGGTKAAFMEF